LATDKFRLDHYGKDVLIINEVGAEQSLYFQQLYILEEMLGWFQPGQRIHVKHGLYRFKEGKMSTRKGNVIWLEEVLAEAIMRAKKLSSHADQDLSEQVAIGAIKWNDLKRDAKQDIAFDWDDILNMQGNSGPYIQYTYVRTQSVLRKAAEQNGELSRSHLGDIAMTSDLEPEERDLLRLLSRFADIVEEAAIQYAPNILCSYLYDLAQKFNLFYQKYPILKAEEHVKDFRLVLTRATGEVIKQGLHLLGMQAPEKM
jgi:arginyl-tRNA synthetase